MNGNENYDAIELLRKINTVMEERNPGAFLIAEESTAWAGVTAPASMKGLGFLYKWNMGWMNDFLEYMKMDPYFRSFNHNIEATASTRNASTWNFSTQNNALAVKKLETSFLPKSKI